MGAAVLDASVFCKIFLDEPDRQACLDFLSHARAQALPLSAPGLFIYEALAVASASGFGAPKAWELISDFVRAGFELVEPDAELVQLAQAMASHGHSKSGFPAFYDTVYHALALRNGAIFVIADARHLAKTREFGHVVLLKNWREAFAA